MTSAERSPLTRKLSAFVALSEDELAALVARDLDSEE